MRPPPCPPSVTSLRSLLAPPLRRPPLVSAPASSPTASTRRWISDKQSFRTRHGNIKVDLTSKHAIGVAQSRGERPYQEDAYTVSSVIVPQPALKRNVLGVSGAAGWMNDTFEGYPGEDSSPGAEKKRQVAFFAVYDGHGGPQVSTYLRTNLAPLLESCKPSDIAKEVDEYRALGGYLKRYRGGPLDRFRAKSDETKEGREDMGLDEMCVLAFLQADNAVLADPSTKKSGSVATLALVHSLDTPHALPYHSSSLISLTIAHLGDTRALLASTSGRVQTLTENHHGDSRVESERLRQSGTGIVTDSFGESRWGGTLANTRGIGDREFKTLGVIGEPEVSKRVLKGDEWSFLVLFSDGISDAMSDQEVVDLCRGIKDPTQAAKKIVSFAEDVGGEDNMTCIVVPLPGWGRMGGVDSSASRREFRLRQVTGASSRQKRM